MIQFVFINHNPVTKLNHYKDYKMEMDTTDDPDESVDTVDMNKQFKLLLTYMPESRFGDN